MLVFVYGTLKKGHWNNRVLGDAKLIGGALLRGYHLFYSWKGQGFPVMQPSKETDLVEGEIWDIGESQQILGGLDRLEGEGMMYDRATVKTEDGQECFAYVGCHKNWRWDDMTLTERNASGDDTVYTWHPVNTAG